LWALTGYEPHLGHSIFLPIAKILMYDVRTTVMDASFNEVVFLALSLRSSLKEGRKRKAL
jgi:hypothetical protein